MTPTPSEPQWLTVARTFTGLHEGVGSLDDPTILGWAKELGGWYAAYYRHDETPWCGLFVGAMVHRCGLPIPANALAARNWGGWGVPLQHGVPGAVMVFQRPGGGHVGFYVGEDESAYYVFGGNQGDKVSEARVEKSRLLAVRWPGPVAIPPDGPVIIASVAGKPMSQNEL